MSRIFKKQKTFKVSDFFLSFFKKSNDEETQKYIPTQLAFTCSKLTIETLEQV